jgi:hypothetical protein
VASPEEFAQQCREASRNMRRLPAELRRTLAARSKADVADPLAAKIAAAASGPYGRALSTAVKTRAAADPQIVVGGARRVVSGGASARQLVFGTEWGGGKRVKAFAKTANRKGYKRRTTRQFVTPHPFVYPTIGANIDTVLEAFATMVEDTFTKVVSDG